MRESQPEVSQREEMYMRCVVIITLSLSLSFAVLMCPGQIDTGNVAILYQSTSDCGENNNLVSSTEGSQPGFLLSTEGRE